MGLHEPFGHLKHKLWPKEGPRVKLAIWFPTTKSRKLFNFVVCKWHATYRWKALDESYNFALDLVSIRGLYTNLWSPKVTGVPTLGILDFHLGVPGQNGIWALAPWLGIKYTIRGKVMVSPKFGPWWVLWVRVCPWFVHAPKCFNCPLTNLWFDLCKSV
jgi:hypothetical protein